MKNYTNEFSFNSDNVVWLEGPISQFTEAPVTNTPPVTSAVARLFDDAKDTYLTDVVLTLATVLDVADTRRLRVNDDRCLVWMDDDTWFDAGVILAIDGDAGTITVQNAIPSPVVGKTRVCIGIGLATGGATPWEIAMTYFNAGTEVAGEFDYGWYAVIPANQPRFDIGTVCRVEMVLDVSAGVKVTKTIYRRIVGGV